MRRFFKTVYIRSLIIGILLIVPVKANALDVFDLDSNYFTSDFYTVPFDSTAIAFDQFVLCFMASS